MSQKQTTGYGERLKHALNQGPRAMSVRSLSLEMSRKHQQIRGSSYGGIRQYVEGSITNPRAELLEAISDVLQIRFEWLAYNQGAMTKRQQEAERSKKGAAVRAEGEIARWDERYEAMDAGMRRESSMWDMAGRYYATEPLVQGLVIDLLESDGGEFITWSPRDIEEATYLLLSLIAMPAQAIRPVALQAVGRQMGKWPEYFAAMTMAIRAALPEGRQGRPRETLKMLRAFKQHWRRMVPKGSSLI